MFKTNIAFLLKILCIQVAFQSVSFASPADRTRLEFKLKMIEQEITKTVSSLNKKKRQKSIVNRELAELTTETKKVEDAVKKISGELGTLERSGKVLQKAVGRVQKEVEERRKSLNSRLITIYQLNRRHAVLNYLFESEDSRDLIRRIRYSKEITDADLEKMSTLKRLILSLHEDRVALTTAQSKQEFVLKKLESISADLDQKKVRKKKLRFLFSKQESELQESIASLRSTSKDLEGLLADMMGANEKVLPVEKLFVGAGLAASKGKLPYPVKGAVVGSFGKVRHDEFDDVLLRKGMEFSVEEGGPVGAVASGNVVMNRVLSKYGRVVILDHGRRFYTLYGRLGKVEVKQGETIAPGGRIGTVGADNFYFELRHKGKAINPEIYLGR